MGGREGGSSVALYMLDGSTLRAAGQVNGIATLDASGRVPTDQLPASIYYYQGMWNASTDTPHLAGTTPTIGYAWSVSVAGTTTLGAISSWAVGDFAVYGALGWSKIPAGGVLTFNGRLGAVVPVAGDYDGLALNLAAASSFVAPASAAAAPTTAAQVAFDTTAKHLKVGDGSSSLTVVDSSSIGVSVQAQSSVLSTLAGNGAPGAFGLARLLDANQAAAQTALGLGTISTQAANSVAITGGSVTGITALAVADGGTGASTAATARDNLGLTIGTNVQAYNANLAAVSGYTLFSPPSYTGVTPTSILMPGRMYDLLANDVADALANPPTGWAWLNSSTVSSANITSGVLTINASTGSTYNTPDANPVLYLLDQSASWSVIAQFRTNGDQSFEGGGFFWHGGTPYIRIGPATNSNDTESWDGTNVATGPAMSADDYFWIYVTMSGGILNWYMQTNGAVKSPMPTVVGTDATTQWKWIARYPLTSTFSASARTYMGPFILRTGAVSGAFRLQCTYFRTYLWQ